jgi:hypothetical protein
LESARALESARVSGLGLARASALRSGLASGWPKWSD